MLREFPDSQRSSDATWINPVEIIPMRAGYDWRQYVKCGPYFLCRDGRPIEVTGPSGNWWRCCTFEPGSSGELRDFAKAMEDA